MANTGREIWKDLLRILSISAIAVLHSCAELLAESDGVTCNWLLVNLYESVLRFSLPCVVMISGSLFLNPSVEKYNKIPGKNIARLLIAFVFWSLVFFAYRVAFQYHGLPDLYLAAENLIRGYHHLWYIWMTIGFYLVVPFFRKITGDKKMVERFLILSFAFSVVLNFVVKLPYFSLLSPTFQNLNLSIGMGYSFYFMFGHYIGEYGIDARLKKVLYILAPLCLVATYFGTYLLYLSSDKTDETFYDCLSPNIAIYAMAFYVFFSERVSKISFSAKQTATITRISKLTFGVFLSHELFNRLYEDIGFTADAFNPFFCIPVKALAVIVTSFIFTALLSKIPVIGKYIV